MDAPAPRGAGSCATASLPLCSRWRSFQWTAHRLTISCRTACIPAGFLGRHRQGEAETGRLVGPPGAHFEAGRGKLGPHALAAELGGHLGAHLLALAEV